MKQKSNIKKQNIKFWTINAPGFDNQITRDTAGTLDFYKKVDEVRYKQEAFFNDLFKEFIESGLISLEVGCGLGSELRTFAREGVKVTGLDYSPENAYLSQMGLRAYNFSGRVVAGDAEYLPFPDNSFDLVYSFGVIHHTPNTQKCLDEFIRVLRPGGKLVAMVYHKGYQFWYLLLSYLVKFKWTSVNLQSYISRQYDHTPLSQMFSKNKCIKCYLISRG